MMKFSSPIDNYLPTCVPAQQPYNFCVIKLSFIVAGQVPVRIQGLSC